jgi:two-component system nitrogen regulation response regulator GlnG/two-component system response regulator HydG
VKSDTTLDAVAEVPMLVVVWSATEPDRLGEVIAPGTGDGALEIGRGDALVRQRPGTNERGRPLDSPFLSRRQLRLARKGDTIAAENLGKRAMLVDGREASTATVKPGQTLEVKSQMVFYCGRRPETLPPLANRDAARLHAFGETDEHGIVGESPAAWDLRDKIAFFAATSPHVLVLGESGTGKELVAQAIHALSARRAKRLVARNAATVPAGLVDAELFGNAANYPNAGMAERPGLVGEADGSTLFLDEIGELPIELQSHLLRVLDEGGEYQRLGDARARKADVRLVAATNRPLEQLKHDLAARLALRMTLPGLDERREDVPLLVRHLLRRRARRDAAIATRFFAGDEPRVSPDLMRALVLHAWSTHVRELEGLLWRSLAASRGATLELTDDVAAEIVRPDAARGVAPIEIGADRIKEALARHAGVQERVWRELGMANRYVLHRLMKKYGIKGTPDEA